MQSEVLKSITFRSSGLSLIASTDVTSFCIADTPTGVKKIGRFRVTRDHVTTFSFHRLRRTLTSTTRAFQRDNCQKGREGGGVSKPATTTASAGIVWFEPSPPLTTTELIESPDFTTSMSDVDDSTRPPLFSMSFAMGSRMRSDICPRHLS
jgi:hypothetical protein